MGLAELWTQKIVENGICHGIFIQAVRGWRVNRPELHLPCSPPLLQTTHRWRMHLSHPLVSNLSAKPNNLGALHVYRLLAAIERNPLGT